MWYCVKRKYGREGVLRGMCVTRRVFECSVFLKAVFRFSLSFFFFERVRLSRGKDSCLYGCAGAIVAEDATRVQRRDG